jgi:tRNA (guanine37-N1)-methyltransferase
MEFQGWEVPSVLVSGNHQEIEQWRRQKAIEKTLRTRPDVAGTAGPGKLEGLKRSGKKSA